MPAATAADFNPRAPRGARLLSYVCMVRGRCISIHAPLAGRDSAGQHGHECWAISIHAPLAGRDADVSSAVNRLSGISIHAPLAGRDKLLLLLTFERDLFQSTRPLRGATFRGGYLRQKNRISIHAPLAGRDGRPARREIPCLGISIHAPLAGRDSGEPVPQPISIHAPLAGRDHAKAWIRRWKSNFNPRAPCGARL